MRLSKIRLAGFKSFVDPTDIKLRSALVGIIGPNGCGKSNTIDAVRWVMGESSAKHLRGESMDDVIFTGSSRRQPVGQASVELVFDNSDGSLGGEYAAYAEIALKREVTREGHSRYLLNNTRCRRRDIRDIFLGTGLGPRSYAIIEQGMVSRLIEAKPEDLRVYLEEAAGISKYKERRRETENRIRHTRDNLDRLDDLREEVDKQIAHLKRQADTAERYQRLKDDERRLRGELLCLRRQGFDASRAEQAVSISQRETELEGVLAELRASETAIEQARVQQQTASDTFGRVQSDFYRIGADVSRIEQQIDFTRKTRQRQQGEMGDVQTALQQAQAHREEDTRRISEISETLASDQPAFDQLQQSQRHSAERLVQAERAQSEWRARNEAFVARRNEVSRTAQVERSRVEQLERAMAAADVRLERQSSELAGLDADPLKAAIEAAIVEEVSAADNETRLQEQLARTLEQQQQQRELQREFNAELNTSRSELQSCIGRLAALDALQQAALEPAGGSIEPWLEARGLAEAGRLAESLNTAAGWEAAVELVLGPYLEAVCVEDDTRFEQCRQALPDTAVTLLHIGTDRAETEPSAAGTLAAKVQGAGPLSASLSRVFIAEGLEQAWARRHSLRDDESVVTRDGYWLGRHWLRVAGGDAGDSVLLRESERVALRETIAGIEERVAVAEARAGELDVTLDELDTRRETVQHALNDALREHSAIQSTLQTSRQRLEQIETRRQRLDEEISEARLQRESEAMEREMADEKRLNAVAELETLEAEAARLADEQETLDAAVQDARQQAEGDRDAGQALAIRVESMRSARTATEQNLARMESRIEELSERLLVLEAAIDVAEDDSLATLERDLADQLDARLTADAAMVSARDALAAVQERLREHEQARVRHDSRSLGVREALQADRMASQEVVVRLQTIDEQLAEHDYDLATISAALPAEATIDEWASALEKTEQRIQRLGPINLAAIDEHAEQLQRKTYLDSQHQDVTDALATLEQAIAKIDRETRARFRETYDSVNEKFMEFFPRLFGGGVGALELTGDDLLSTGVAVMAQPPGKRVNNIQLLSGGEKALTAVALVFAFFELNPSPFCMLDEVDAPLDDANVGRFCTLVKEMSERVQFIFITHNKVTMEMADQLMGVTMNEPGVSRLVAVDVQEAVELAGV